MLRGTREESGCKLPAILHLSIQLYSRSVLTSEFLLKLQLNGDISWEKDMVKVLKNFLELLKDDKTVSSYELQTSGVVRALLHCLSQVCISHCARFCQV